MIYLFDKTEKLTHVFKRESIIEAIQEEVVNELVTLSLVLPLFYFDKEVKVEVSKKIEAAHFVGHFDKNDDFQLYKIIRVAEPAHIEVLGIHIAFDELKTSNIIKDRRLTNSTAGNALTVSLEGSRWQVGAVEDLGEKSYTLYYVPPLDAITKWRNNFQAETRFRLTFDGQRITGRFVDGVKQVGRDTGRRFVHGHNALDVIREQDFSEIYTAIIGRGKGEETLDEDGDATGGHGRRIGFEGIAWTSPDGKLTKPAGQDYLEFPERTALYGHTDGKPRYKVEVFDDVDNPYILLLDTYDYLLDVSRPRVLFKSTVADVGDVLLGDRVHIIRKELDIHYTTRIHKVARNLLNDKLTSVEIGDYDFFRKDKSKRRTADAIGAIENEVEAVKNATRSKFEQTNEQFLFEVERLDGEISEAITTFTITADGIVADVAALRTYTDEELGQVKEEASSNFSILAGEITAAVSTTKSYTDGLIGAVRQENTSNFNILSGRINAKAESSTVTALGTRVNNVEWDLNAVEGQISQKVSYTDYTGNTIVSRINQSATTIDIYASRINLVGAVSVLSDISGNLGNITTGNINISNDITVGNNIHLSPNSSGQKMIRFFNTSNIMAQSGADNTLTFNTDRFNIAARTFNAPDILYMNAPKFVQSSGVNPYKMELAYNGGTRIYVDVDGVRKGYLAILN